VHKYGAIQGAREFMPVKDKGQHFMCLRRSLHAQGAETRQHLKRINIATTNSILEFSFKYRMPGKQHNSGRTSL
jgi:hypothetical protein